MEEEKKPTALPENAFRKLAPGEQYEPLLKPAKSYPEITAWSVTLGLIMTVIFSAAAAYLGLKVGQVFEAAIPIAILAVGFSSAAKKKGALGQNVIIQSIGACSGVIVAGAVFTLPAIYILGLDVNFVQMFLSSLLGGVLGILFLIPFRKYFVKEQHGEYPFPEATATTQVLVSGESGGKSLKTLLTAGLIGGIYDFIVATFGAWAETLSTTVMHCAQVVADKAKVVLKINTGAAVLGLGYIIGLKYAFVICCGSLLVWLVAIPLMGAFCGGVDFLGMSFSDAIGQMSADEIFRTYARQIGIGGIATAGIIGIIRQSKVIKDAVGMAVREFGKKGAGAQVAQVERTQRDISMKTVVFGIVIALLGVFAFCRAFKVFADGKIIPDVDAVESRPGSHAAELRFRQVGLKISLELEKRHDDPRMFKRRQMPHADQLFAKLQCRLRRGFRLVLCARANAGDQGDFLERGNPLDDLGLWFNPFHVFSPQNLEMRYPAKHAAETSAEAVMMTMMRKRL